MKNYYYFNRIEIELVILFSFKYIVFSIFVIFLFFFYFHLLHLSVASFYSRCIYFKLHNFLIRLEEVNTIFQNKLESVLLHILFFPLLRIILLIL